MNDERKYVEKQENKSKKENREKKTYEIVPKQA